jgi:FKBP-type peptidyl-prolyl cis-trans isomerase FkpA
MSRVLFIFLFFCSFLAACQKSTDSALAGAKAQAVIDDKIISNYLAQNPGLIAKRIDTTGVYYIIKQTGTVSALFTNSTQVTVADTGRLLYDPGKKTYTGQVFTQTNDFHPSYILSTVIKGWQLGIPKCQTGGIVRILMPSRYAYGPNAQPNLGPQVGLTGGLPANAVLDFDVALFAVSN